MLRDDPIEDSLESSLKIPEDQFELYVKRWYHRVMSINVLNYCVDY